MSESVDTGLRIIAALDYAKASGEDVRPHYLDSCRQITEDVNLDDLTTAELVALKALLIPAHARFLAGTPQPPEGYGRLLRLVRDTTAV